MSAEEEPLDAVREALNSAPRGIFQCPADGAGGMPEDDEEDHLPVRTSILYPGGEPINVYIRTNRSGYLVTDKGNATRMIVRHLPVDAGQWTSTAQKICKGLDVKIHSKEWTVQAKTPEDVGRAAITLAQALLRMSIMAPIFKIMNER